jgi:hypothetical protein
MEKARELGFKWFRAKVSKRPLTKKLEYPVKFSRQPIVSGDIKCRALNEQSAYIDARAQIFPCCWLASPIDNKKIDFDEIQKSWGTESPHQICKTTCGVQNDQSNFSNQWIYEVEL